MEKSASLINRVFNLRPGDFSRGLSLFGYYFLIIASYVMCQTVRIPLFLDKFKTVQLPYVDIAVAAMVPIVIAIYMRIGKDINLKNLLVGSLVFCSANVFVLWWGAAHYQRAWVTTVLYVWVGVFGVLAPAQVWTLANFLWTTREAKRLFGLLASGGTVGNIFAGFLSNYMAKRFGTESLLLVVGIFVGLSAFLVLIIYDQHQKDEPEAHKDQGEENRHSLRESLRLVSESPHLQAIAGLICLSSIITTAAGWQFNAIAKEAIRNKDALTAFLGTFTGYTGIGALIAQLLITGKLLRRFGVGVALLVLPLFLMGGAAAVLVWGTLSAATILRASDKVIRYSIDKSGVELLYLPVQANVKGQVKSFIDTVIWRLGDGMAGLTVLLFANILRFTPRQVSWVTLPLLGLWVIVAMIARSQYIATLKQNIQQVQVRPEATSVETLDQFTTNVFAEKLGSNDVNEVMYALDLFGMAQRLNAQSAVRNLLEHPSPHVRAKAISVLNNGGDVSVRPLIASMIADPNLDVRTEALLYLSRHDEMDPLSYVEQLRDFADVSIRSATVSFLMKPGETQNAYAAKLILHGMITDLENPALAADAARALALLGDVAVDSLRDQLSDGNASLHLRRQIPPLLLQIGTPACGAALGENLVQADPELRSKVISALNKLCEFQRDLKVDRPAVESAMMAEMMGHYRSYQILGSSKGKPSEELEQNMAEELERIFRLMKLMFPSLDLQNAYLGIRSTDPVRHANALEFLDNTLNADLRARLVPLIDSEVTFEERVRLADRFLGFSVNA
jgi:ATP:ADP antiporter, AAA family